jgi:hypothetical protein
MDYRKDLLIAISIPSIILLVFGGRLSLLIICFGALVSYIFDIIGSVEVRIKKKINYFGKYLIVFWTIIYREA